MIRQKLAEEMKNAMRNKDAKRLETIRFIWSEMKYQEIDKKQELGDEDLIALMQREVKKRSEAIEQMKKMDRVELVSEEEDKLKIIKEFLPEMMSEAEIGKVVDEVLASGVTDFGRVMGQVMGKVKGKAEGGMVNKIVKEKLN
jgi:uncharacterized protein YqeY